MTINHPRRSNPTRRSIWVAFLVIMVMIAAACAAEGPDDDGALEAEEPAADTEEPAADTEEPADAADDSTAASELVYLSSIDFTTMASMDAVSATTALVQWNVQESLIGRDQETGEFIPMLATDWEWVDDLTLRMAIREGVSFHDGTPLNAETAAAATNINFSPDRPAGRLLGFQVVPFEAVAVDDYTLEIRTEEPYPNVVQLMWLSALPSPAHFENEGVEAWESEPVGTGPYQFVEWNRSRSIVELERNPDWWGHDDPDAADGRADFERVRIEYRSDPQSRIAAVAAGEADVAELVPGDACRNDLGEQCFEADSIDNTYIRVDHPHPVLGDRRIRQAVAHALPREQLAEEVFPGEPIRMVLSPAGVGYNEDIPLIEYDPDRARELVEEARADGVPVEQELLLRGDPRLVGLEDVGVVLEAELTAIGLNIGWQLLENEVYRSDILLKDHPEDPVPDDRGAILIHRSSDRMQDFFVTAAQLFSCTDVISTYCNPEFDAQVQAAGQIADPDERHETLKELASFIFEEELAMIPFIATSNFHGLSDGVAWDYRSDTNVLFKNMRVRD